MQAEEDELGEREEGEEREKEHAGGARRRKGKGRQGQQAGQKPREEKATPTETLNF